MWLTGPWAQSVQHPSSGLTKEYIVTTTTSPTAKQFDLIAGGCEVDNAFVAPVSVSLITDQRTKFRVVVAEGRNREVPPFNKIQVPPSPTMIECDDCGEKSSMAAEICCRAALVKKPQMLL